MVFTWGTIVAAAGWLLVAGAGPMLATDWAALPEIVWIAILYLAAIATAGSFLMIQYATMRLPARITSYNVCYTKLLRDSAATAPVSPARPTALGCPSCSLV